MGVHSLSGTFKSIHKSTFATELTSTNRPAVNDLVFTSVDDCTDLYL